MSSSKRTRKRRKQHMRHQQRVAQATAGGTTLSAAVTTSTEKKAPPINGSTMKQLPLYSHSGGYYGGYTVVKQPVGNLPLRFFGFDLSIMGGPYEAIPSTKMYGVKMAEEISKWCDIDIPTQDFKTPNPSVFHVGLLMAMVAGTLGGKELYVGCKAGHGRTGLFMAAAAYVSGQDNPIGYVRKHYYAKAVETLAQEAFIYSIDVPQFRRLMVRVLQHRGAIDFTRLRAMSWAERWAWVQVKCGF